MVSDNKIVLRVGLLFIILNLSLSVILVTKQHSDSSADRELKLVAELLATDHEGAVGGIQQMLTMLATSREFVSDEYEFCNTVLERASIIFPYFINIGAVDTEGKIVCSGASWPADETFGNDEAFSELKRTKNFTVSGSTISVTTGWPAVRFLQPYFNKDGTFAGAYFATFATQWLNGFSPSFSIPEDVTITKFDQYGTVFMRYPNPTKWSGTHQAESELFQTILRKKEGRITAHGLDGITREYYVRPIYLDGKVTAYVAVGA